MTKQEAIWYLETARMMLIAPNGNPIPDLAEALSIAIEALARNKDEKTDNCMD